MNKLIIIGLLLPVVSFILGLIVIWWWALLGMDIDVATAWIVTCVALLTAGLIIIFIGASV